MNEKTKSKYREEIKYLIAEDLRLIAERYKEKDPVFASEAMKICKLYLAESKEEPK